MDGLDRELERTFTKHLKQSHTNGMLVGAKAMCQTILDMIENTTETSDTEKLKKITQFCKTGLGK